VLNVAKLAGSPRRGTGPRQRYRRGQCPPPV